jgi:endonuclease/exonuclease/phosphatase family metal-dependent hydrolase
MPFYYSLYRENELVRDRAAQGLLRLRESMRRAKIPRRSVETTLLLATWNIREFGGVKHGGRLRESYYYIAEVLHHFDLIAIQEVREDLTALDEVQRILGGWWKYLVTDVTEGKSGNGERMAFLYDSRKVTFGGLAGEIVLPPDHNPDILQFARTPFICGFKAGWSKFNLCTVHIYYGDDNADDPRRVAEIHNLAALLAKRAKKPRAQPARPDGKVTAVRNREPENLILLGDFNIFKPSDATMAALTANKFIVPDVLQTLPSNVAKNKHYDQIAFRERPHRFEATGAAGVFDFYESVYRPEDRDGYKESLGEKFATSANPDRYYRDWRTYQMSDHLVLWMEFRIDFSDEYLTEMRAQEQEDQELEPA